MLNYRFGEYVTKGLEINSSKMLGKISCQGKYQMLSENIGKHKLGPGKLRKYQKHRQPEKPGNIGRNRRYLQNKAKHFM
jgi:hypothetical protein